MLEIQESLQVLDGKHLAALVTTLTLSTVFTLAIMRSAGAAASRRQKTAFPVSFIQDAGTVTGQEDLDAFIARWRGRLPKKVKGMPKAGEPAEENVILDVTIKPGLKYFLPVPVDGIFSLTWTRLDGASPSTTKEFDGKLTSLHNVMEVPFRCKVIAYRLREGA